MDDLPVARVGRIRVSVLAAEADEGILPCENCAIWVGNAHLVSPVLELTP